MMSAKILIVLFLIAVLLPANVFPALAQSSTNVKNLLVNLEIAPGHIDKKNSIQSIGYLNLVNSKGIAVKAPQDIVVTIESDDPLIAAVPSEVIIPQNHNFAIFDMEIGNIDGETTISATLNEKIDYKEIMVGGSEDSMPDDIELKINLPTNNMHVNSEMPFSVYLESDGNIIRAPYDIELEIDFEESLLEPEQEELIIKKGHYYTWSSVKTFENIGNAFLRASFDRFDLHTSENIEITSSLPSDITISIFPSRIPAEPERPVDIFVSLLDPDGLPSVTPEDIPIKLFSDNDSVGGTLDDAMEERNIVIKKGEFGYYLREQFNLQNLEGEEVLIGASAEDLGIAMGELYPVETLNIEHPKAENSTVAVFLLDKIPANTTSIMVYQLSAKGTDQEFEECLENDIECIKHNQELDRIEHPIDELEDGDLYPLQGNENFYSQGSIEKINVVSSDNSILKIQDAGSIPSSNSYGTALIKSGQKTGEVTVAATVKGVGAGVNSTEIVDIFKHSDTKIFSPTGDNKIVLDKNGYFDLFLVALDGKQRPKILESPTKYILNPVNQVLEIKEGESFAYANFHSDSFSAGLDESINVKAVPIGVEADLNLEESSNFESQSSSVVAISLPFENLDASTEQEYYGIVQLTDLLGNPGTASKDLRVKLDLGGTNIVEAPEHVTIQEGDSYATFPIIANGDNGDATISASAKGVIGSEAKLSTVSNLFKLKIFANSIETPLEPGKPVQLEVFIDDENAESVPGAIVKFVTSNDADITPDDTRTNNEGRITADLAVNEGPNVSVQVLATADGYLEAERTFDYEVIDTAGTSIALGLPDWVIYVGIAAVIGIVAVLLVFLKKPKQEYEDEEDDYYEYEDEI